MAFVNDDEFEDDFRKVGTDVTAGFERAPSPFDAVAQGSSENLSAAAKTDDLEEDTEDDLDEDEEDDDEDDLEDDELAEEDDEDDLDDDDLEDDDEVDDDDDDDEDDEDDLDDDLEEDNDTAKARNTGTAAAVVRSRK